MFYRNSIFYRNLIFRRFSIFSAVLLFGFTAACHANEVADKDAITAMLNDFHLAASEADSARYFEHFSEDAVFLGTDASERWTVEDFRAFAEPFFSKGIGWTYLPTRRHITLHQDGTVGWFDELLDSVKYGVVRGNGVVVKTPAGWKVSLYDLHYPIPNELMGEISKKVITFNREASEAAAETAPATPPTSESDAANPEASGGEAPAASEQTPPAADPTESKSAPESTLEVAPADTGEVEAVSLDIHE